MKNPFDEMTVISIEVIKPDFPMDRVKNFCAHWGVKAEKVKGTDNIKLSTDNPENLYLLGLNMNNNQLNQLLPNAISFYREI